MCRVGNASEPSPCFIVCACACAECQDDRRAEADVCSRLGDYFITKADPTGDGRWEGESRRYFADLVFYQLKALRVSKDMHMNTCIYVHVFMNE